MATQLRDGIRQMMAERAAIWMLRDALYIDTETTGLGRDDQVCEVAVMDGSGAMVFDTLIRPTVPIQERAREIHGITEYMLLGAPSFAQIDSELRALLTGRLVVAYNVDFDKRLLNQTAVAHGLLEYAADFQCGMRLYAAYYEARAEGAKWHKLIDAAGQSGIKWGHNQHRARDDARVLRELIAFMAQPKPKVA